MLSLRAGQIPAAQHALDRIRGAEGRADYLATRACLARRMGDGDRGRSYAAQAREVDAALATQILELLGKPLTEEEFAEITAASPDGAL